MLKFHAARSTLCGLEMHLAMIHKLTNEFQPSAVIMDPITNLSIVAGPNESEIGTHAPGGFFQEPEKHHPVYQPDPPAGTRDDHQRGFLPHGNPRLLLLSVESNGERNRVFQLLKSRGMDHSDQMREFIVTDRGIDLLNVYLGPGGGFTGSAKLQQEAQEKAEGLGYTRGTGTPPPFLDRKRQIMEAQVAAGQAEMSVEEEELQALEDQSKLQEKIAAEERERLAEARKADAPKSK